MEKIRQQIINLVLRSNSILIMPSMPVDGDSLGSSLAMYLLLKKLGKQVTVVCADPVPEAFQFLPTTKVISDEFTSAKDFIVTLDCHKAKINSIRTKLEHDKVNIIVTAKKGQFTKDDVSFHHGPSKYDLIMTVDTGGLEQLGRFHEDNPELFTSVPLINIDHHASNDHFGKVNYVDIMASATTELLIPLIQDFEKETKQDLMDEDIATLLLAGIITDTGSFQNANTTPRSFAAAAFLIKHGARQQEIIQHVFKTKQLSTLRLWGRILSKIKVEKEHKLVWSSITKKDLMDTGSTPDETGGIIDELLSNAPDADVVLILKQKEDNLLSGSLRTTSSSVDGSAIAEMFGGGGHVRAAGFKIETDDYAATEEMVIKKICEFQAKRLKLSSPSFKPEEAIKSKEVEAHTKIESPARQIEKTTAESPKKQVEKSTEKVAPSTPITPEKTEKESEPKVLGNPQKKDEVLKATPPPSQSDETNKDSFTDEIIKRAINEDEETELEPDAIYKFEQEKDK